MWVRIKVFVLAFLLIISADSEGQYVPKFDIQGHRGAAGIAPENTIPAFLAGLEYGVTTLELDVVITADHQVVVSHEPWMSSSICTDKNGDPIRKSEEKSFNIYKMTHDEVALYDCGSIPKDEYPEQQHSIQRKPLLKEVIVAVENYIKSYTQYEVDYSIEIKSTKQGDNVFHPAPEEFSDLVFNLVNQYLPLNRVVIQSFDMRVLQYWHKKHPEVRLSFVVDNLRSVSGNLGTLGFNPSIYSPAHRLVTGAAVKYLHARKIRIIPWTVNDVERIKKLKELGVDGVITDYPNRTQNMGLGVKKIESGNARSAH